MSYGLAAKCAVALTDDGLLALEARGGVQVAGRALSAAIAAASGAPAPARSAAAGRKLGGGASRGGSSGGGASVASLRAAFAGGAAPSGRVELTQVLLGVNGSQDIKLTLGYDLAAQQGYARVKENNWAVRCARQMRQLVAVSARARATQNRPPANEREMSAR